MKLPSPTGKDILRNSVDFILNNSWSHSWEEQRAATEYSNKEMQGMIDETYHPNTE